MYRLKIRELLTKLEDNHFQIEENYDLFNMVLKE